MKDLSTQQLSLSSTDYDLRITNLARFIYRMLPSKSGNLIDIGAGNGLFLKFFKNRGFVVEGIELEKDQVHEMKNDYKLQGVKVRQGDITKLRGNAKYDVVVASDVIEHIKDDRKALKNLWTFVKKDGYLVITVPAHSHLFGQRDLAWGHHRRYDKNDLIGKVGTLENADVVSTKLWNTPGYFAYFFYEKILRRPIAEGFRYKKSFLSHIVRSMLELELRVEEMAGGLPVGLTRIAIIRKS